MQHPEQGDDVRTADPAMDHSAQLRVCRLRIEAPDVSRRLGPHRTRHGFDGAEDGRDAPERERRRAKADDLLVLRFHISPDDLHRVGR